MATLGLLGLPWSGVTTVMRCLCGQSVAQDASQGVADVRDPRLGALAEVSESAKVVPATLEVVDLTRLVRGAKRGEGLGPELLAHMRTTDAVLLVVRCFQDEGVAHPSGKVDPLDDAETVELELVFADQAAVERRLERTSKLAKSGDKELAAERDVLETLAAALEEGRPARSLDVEVPEALDLLTASRRCTSPTSTSPATRRPSSGCGRSAPIGGSRRRRWTRSWRPRSPSSRPATARRSSRSWVSSSRRSSGSAWPPTRRST